MEEVPGAEQLCISYSTGQICLWWPPAQACPLPTLPPVLSPRAALAEGGQRLWLLCRQHGCCSLPFPSPHLTIAPGSAAEAGIAENKLKIQAGGRGGGCATFPAAPLYFSPRRGQPHKTQMGDPCGSLIAVGVTPRRKISLVETRFRKA